MNITPDLGNLSLNNTSNDQNILKNKIRIVQHNCARSLNVMHSLLNSVAKTADIVLIQEPWIAGDHKSTISHPAFTSFLPPSNSMVSIRPRTMTFVSKNRQNLICTPRSDISMNSDLQILSVSTDKVSSILLFNIYNEKSQQKDNDTWTIDRILTKMQLPQRAIICGDFNAHHTW